MINGLFFTALGVFLLYRLYCYIFVDAGETAFGEFLMNNWVSRLFGKRGTAIVDATLGPLVTLYGLLSINDANLTAGKVCSIIVFSVIGIALVREGRRTHGFRDMRKRVEIEPMPELGHKPKAADPSRDRFRWPYDPDR